MRRENDKCEGQERVRHRAAGFALLEDLNEACVERFGFRGDARNGPSGNRAFERPCGGVLEDWWHGLSVETYVLGRGGKGPKEQGDWREGGADL